MKPKPEDICGDTPRGVAVADSITASVCGHGTVTVVLHRKGGKAFAQFSIPLGTWATLDRGIFNKAVDNCPDMLTLDENVEAWAGLGPGDDEADDTATRH